MHYETDEHNNWNKMTKKGKNHWYNYYSESVQFFFHKFLNYPTIDKDPHLQPPHVNHSSIQSFPEFF